MNSIEFTVTCDRVGYSLVENADGLRIVYANVDKEFIARLINGSESMIKLVKFHCDKVNRKLIRASLVDVCVVP